MKTTQSIERSSGFEYPLLVCSSTDVREGPARMQEQCHGVCPRCLNYCALNMGHFGNHRCSQGHEW